MSGKFVQEYAEFLTGKRPVVAPSNVLSKLANYEIKVFFCNLSTEIQNTVPLALDAASFIPGEGLVGTATQAGVSFGVITNSAMHNDTNGVVLGATGFQLAALTPAAESIGGNFAKAIPYFGWGVSAIATANDLGNAYGDYKACMNNP